MVRVAVVLQNTIQRLRDILHYKVQKQLIPWRRREEAVLQADDVGVLHGTHKLQLPVLVTPILQHLLDGEGLPGLQTLSLHAKADSIHIASAISSALEEQNPPQTEKHTWKTIPNEPVPTTRSAM